MRYVSISSDAKRSYGFRLRQNQCLNLRYCNDELEVEVVPNEEHEWLLSTKDVAEGYGLTPNAIRLSKSRNSDELIEGKHFIVQQIVAGSLGTREATMWTKRGVVRLGFFIKTPMAKEFRDWAEDYIIDGQSKPKTPTIPQTFSEALLLAAEQARMLELQAPKVEVYDAQTPMPSKGRT